MQEAIDKLLPELTKAREEYERYVTICQNPYAGNDEWRMRDMKWGRWNGVAKAIEILKCKS